MPILVVYGMPNLDDVAQVQLIDELRRETANIRQLNLSVDDVSVFFNLDRVDFELGTELICFVEGLFVKPERTIEVRNQLADSIKNVLVQFAIDCVPYCQKVEVLVKKFDPEKDGFAVYEIVPPGRQ